MKDLMIDIETMGDTANATMIQLAAVFFDRETGETGREFCMCISEDECLKEGFVSNESTKIWWESQNQQVLADIRANAKHPKEVMEAFIEFLGKDLFYTIIWSHATFDFPIVQAYMKKFTKKYMSYKGARDIRTLVDLSGIDLDSYNWGAKTHNALDDCKFQIKYCVDAMNKLKGK